MKNMTSNGDDKSEDLPFSSRPPYNSIPVTQSKQEML